MMDGHEKSDPAIASAERRMSLGLKPPALGWGAPYPKMGTVLRYPKGEEGMETSKRVRRRKLDRARTDLKPPLDALRRTGVRSDLEAEEYAEKYRAVIDWGKTPDEQVGQGWDRSSPGYGGEGVAHSPMVPRCLLTARYGRFMRGLRRRVDVLVFDQISDPISGSEMGRDRE
jgi:hypothetical protein